MVIETQKNVDRFKGFAEIYDSARPVMPLYPIKLITQYLEKQPERVVDLGCGTGLSTSVWKNYSQQVIGIEPSGDMLAVAQQKQADNISFIKGYSHETGLEDNSADIVICSQSFHWMEPVATLREVNRILKKGGVFATVDCDWPPVTKWQAEQAYSILCEKVEQLEINMPDIRDSFKRYAKINHLNNIKSSGYFRYAREVLFNNTEQCTAERFIKIILSQGGVQTVLKKHSKLLENDISEFNSKIKQLFDGNCFEIDFCYRMRVAIK